ncbi:MAG: GMC family oxidoreductase N-terminal domain-containing protein [Actinomycetota bacterium]|nr:GMC family oxidoreductase N-terminal domain-containing protein [Actinomycetota bacterium]
MTGTTQQADVIVVGAGTAGCVLTRRLIDAGRRVLLLEAGPDGRFDAVSDPQRMHELWDSELDWKYRTVPQVHAHGRRLQLPRGRLVGGSHAFNAMIWVRGNPLDYDTWAYLGNPGWAWSDVEPVFQRLENRDGAGDGLLDLITKYVPDEIHQAIVAASVAAGVPFNDDYNGPVQDGVSFMQFTIRDGLRLMTADAHLDPIRGSGLLEVQDRCLVHSVILDGDRCVGVQYERDGQLLRARADQVVLSAGALGSPAILERSGIGDPAVLAAAGVEVRVRLPGVGANLQDHWLVPVLFSTVRPPPLPVGLPPNQSHLFWRSQAGLPVPDLQPIHFGRPLPTEWMIGPAQGFSLMAGLVRPASRGTTHIGSADPRQSPLIDPRVLSSSADVLALTAAVRLCQDIGQQPPLSTDWGAQEIYPASLATSAELIGDYIRETVVTYHHQAGSCAMGSPETGVVDSRLAVHGVSGLRVADASIMPLVTTGNTNAPTAMIAERAADFMLGR